MNSSQHFENENLKDKSFYFFWLIIAIAGIIGFQILNPLIKPNRYSGSIIEWVFTCISIVSLTVYFIYHKRFVSIFFDTSKKKIVLTTMSLIRGTTTYEYNFDEIIFKEGKEPGGLRKSASQFIKIYEKTNLLIKITRVGIGENTFDNFRSELALLKFSH